MNRRELMKNLSLGVGAMTLTKAMAHGVEKASCFLTPPQVKGPFYPLVEPDETDFDLTKIEGSNVRARGQKVIVKGIIMNEQCLPLKGAIVEVWQACHTGKYNHPDDPSNAELDPHFQYFARLTTNENGEYSFKSIIPGSYAATTSWTRPPHIHFRILAKGYKELVTQMYFKGQALNHTDQILMSLRPEERESLVVNFEPLIPGSDLLLGNFPIVIKQIQEG